MQTRTSYPISDKDKHIYWSLDDNEMMFRTITFMLGHDAEGIQI